MSVEDDIADEHGRVPCIHCGALQYPGSPYCLACGEDNPVPAASPEGER